MGVLVPARRRGREILDDPGVDPTVRLLSIGDVTASNRLFGGRRAALAELRAAAPFATLLDVGTGLADIPGALSPLKVTTIGLDDAHSLLGSARPRLSHAVCGSAGRLPFRNRSVDVVLCSQLLHHFADDDVSALIAELDRVARKRVIIADLRRSWLAAGGFWAASVALRFHPVTRHDGVVSVLRGFTAGELRRSIADAVGVEPDVRERLGFRLTASWAPRKPL
jgi:SAM-dependent methyltransferase